MRPPNLLRPALAALVLAGLLPLAAFTQPGMEPSADDWVWPLPPGFPEPAVPGDNPMSEAKVRLGHHLFYDERLSGNGTLSCAGCHRQELAFTDGRARAIGSTGEAHPRGAMSLANVAWARTLNWADPGLETLEAQLDVPLFNQHPVELGVTGHEEIIEGRLRADPTYRRLFAAAFPEAAVTVSIDNVKRALASFERTLISGGSAYDRLVFEDDREALSPEARDGMRLFFSERLRCFECHAGVLFSGVTTRRGEVPPEPEFHNTGLYGIGASGAYPVPNRGVFEHTRRESDMGRFKAPTLRNVALTAPYMHDGSLETLEAVVRHYAAGGRRIASGPSTGDGRVNPHRSERVTGFEVTDTEIRQLVAFLESLTDEDFVRDPCFSDPWRRATDGTIEGGDGANIRCLRGGPLAAGVAAKQDPR